MDIGNMQRNLVKYERVVPGICVRTDRRTQTRLISLQPAPLRGRCNNELKLIVSSLILHLHCESRKQDTKLKLLPITSPNVNRFSKFFR